MVDPEGPHPYEDRVKSALKWYVTAAMKVGAVASFGLLLPIRPVFHTWHDSAWTLLHSILHSRSYFTVLMVKASASNGDVTLTKMHENLQVYHDLINEHQKVSFV